MTIVEVLGAAGSGTTPDAHPRLWISVASRALAGALESVALRHGALLVDERRSGDLVVTDLVGLHDTPHDPAGDTAAARPVIVCEPTPLSARRALDEVAGLRATAVVLSDEPQGLAAALDAVDDGRLTLPQRVVELAHRMPSLTERQLVILGGVAAGQSNAEIARSLVLSTKSVKREIGCTYQLVGGTDRAELIEAAIGLGLAPVQVTCSPGAPRQVGAARSSAPTPRGSRRRSD